MAHLRTYLKSSNLRQSEFADLVGATQATISKLVNGVALPGLELAVRIEQVTAGAVPASSWIADDLPVAPTEMPTDDATTSPPAETPEAGGVALSPGVRAA